VGRRGQGGLRVECQRAQAGSRPLFHREHPQQADFSVAEIVERVRRARQGAADRATSPGENCSDPVRP
jgi:hypothetical protein